MLYLLSALSVIYIMLMYYISLLLFPPDGFVLCYIGLLGLTLWRFDDDIISPSPGKGRYTCLLSGPCLLDFVIDFAWHSLTRALNPSKSASRLIYLDLR